MIRHQCNLLGAWRRYRKMSQDAFAEKMGVTQSVIVQLEKAYNPHRNMLEKVAELLGCDVEQLTV